MPSSLIKQAKWRQLYRAAVTASTAFLATLESASDTALTKIEGGRAITGEAGNGFSGTFQILDGYSPEEAAELIAELLNIYAEAVAELAAEGEATPSDLEIHDRGLLLLKPRKSIANDYSQMCLR